MKRLDFVFFFPQWLLLLFSKVPRNKNNTQIYSLETVSKKASECKFTIIIMTIKRKITKNTPDNTCSSCILPPTN